MPTYDYKCTKCGYEFEVFHKISEEPKIKCPHCNKKAMRIMSFNSNIIFKGEGFYVNDYKKSKEKPKTEIKDSTKSSKCENCPNN